MRNKRGYAAHLSGEAVALVVTLSKSGQRKVLDLADALAVHPSRVSDWRTQDDAGHFIENLTVSGFHFVYWIDHPAKEVRILEIHRI
jgi:hypothetical protein